MKIVIIGRCIYPYTSPRSFRATELAKYFAKKGHDVTLYGSLGKFDYGDFIKATKVKVKNLGKMRFAIVNSDVGAPPKPSFLNRLLIKCLNRLIEFPDIELAYRTYNVLRNEKNVDLLITIAAPFPLHWGAAWAKKRFKGEFPKTWASDCGDPYMGNLVWRRPLKYFQLVEDFWGKCTDFITIPIEEGRKAYSRKVQDKIRVIPQGFDFSSVRVDADFKGNAIPHFLYAGAVYKDYRDPEKFLDYLCCMQCNFRFVVYTKCKAEFAAYQERLGDRLVINDNIPREELIYKMSQMDFLINFTNKGSSQSPSKLIDYALTGRPILDISSSFVEENNFNAFIKGDYSGKHPDIDVQKYNIENVGNQFLELAGRKQRLFAYNRCILQEYETGQKK